MSLKKNLCFLSLTLGVVGALLQGCGFRPLYQSPEAASPTASVEAVYIAPIKERPGQILRNELQKNFAHGHQKAHAPYGLEVELDISESELGFRRDETSRRVRLTLRATYRLVRRATLDTLLSQTTSVVTGYSVGSTASFASLPLIVSEKDAIQRGLVQLAQDIHMSVASFLVSTRQGEATP